MSFRSTTRHLVLDALSFKNQVQNIVSPATSAPVVQFVLFHQVLQNEEGHFDRFLSWLGSEYEVVSHSKAVNILQSGQSDKRYASISFDDGLQNNVAAARIMASHGMSGCFFVCPSIVGETNQSTIDQFCRERMLFNQSDKFMDWDALRALLDKGHEIGNHSQNHYYMMDLSDDQFDEEVSSAREKIVSELGSVDHFAWPYGRYFHFKKERVARVLELGHQSCASGERGAHQIAQSQENANRKSNSSVEYCLRRDSLDISWPLRHCKYFLQNSSARPVTPNLAWHS